MDRQPVFGQPSSHMGAPGSSPQLLPDAAVPAPWQQLRDRRRGKPQLSCSFCRSRKIRCDRQLPCQTCTSRGIGPSCTYPSGESTPPRNNVGVGGRIHQLEALVRSLMQQQGRSAETLATTPREGTYVSIPSRQSLGHTPGVSQQGKEMSPVAVAEDDAGRLSMTHLSRSPGRGRAVISTPSECGSMLQYSHGSTYVGNLHWAAVLDSICELKEYYEEEEARMKAAESVDYMPHNNPGPRFLYAPTQATRAEILASIPTRQVVDRMVARYFNPHYIASLPLLHRSRFLREYESFWQDPDSASILWIGLLFSIMALTVHLQVLMADQSDPDTVARAYLFRERTTHCLTLGQFTRAKEHVLETMLNYIFLEMMLCKDADKGLWLVLGMLVQLALSLGYHRDAQNFKPNMSPFTGEMRRRVWAVVVQMDLRLSSQMGLPRLLKLHQCDTAEPRNLLDTDFDEDTAELPPSRLETEVTPVLYLLAKNRIDRLSDLISDYVNMAKAWEHSYTEIIELDRKIQEGVASLPAIFQWQPFTISQSLMLTPQIIAHRVLLHLSKQRLTIWLHRRYLAPSYTDARYTYSRNACIQAAIEILKLQKLIDEETQDDGVLYSVRFLVATSLAQFVFLLGMSILSYYLQLAKHQPETVQGNDMADQNTTATIHELLYDSYPIWLRSSSVSWEARKAARHLRSLLGLQEHEGDVEPGEEATEAAIASASFSDFITSQDAGMPFDQVLWNENQGTGTSWCL